MPKNLYLTLDLNLLKTFIVLHQELNMRAASKRLFVSQPAISQALKKLRNHFNDELFVKVPSGVKSTPFADDLASRMKPLLDKLESEINSTSTFIPEDIEQSIKIAMPSIFMYCFGGRLFTHLQTLAPKAKIELLDWNNTTLQSLDRDEITIGLHYDLPVIATISNIEVAGAKGLVLTRKGHPLAAQDDLRIEDLADYKLASIINSGWNDNFVQTTDIARAHGVNIQVGLRSESFQALLDVISTTDMFIGFTTLFPIKEHPKLTTHTLHEIEENPTDFTWPIFAYYHKKNDKNPLTHWLTEEIGRVIQAQIKHNLTQ
ncbi:transcriptional regulator [Vibrio astriarenae]|nr:transcriptional regulator [Vibrio sp. C7]